MADHSGELINGFVGLVGGIVGALAGAYAANHWGLKAAREARVRQEKELDDHVGFAIIHKLNKIYSGQKSVRKALEEAVTRLDKSKAAAERDGQRYLDHLALEVRPFATALGRVHFSTDEVRRSLKIGGQEIARIMMVLDDRHNTTADLLESYRIEKAEFEGVAKPGASFDMARGYLRFQWSDEDYESFKPHLFKLDELAGALLTHSREDEQSAYEALVAILKGRSIIEGAGAKYRVPAPDGRMAQITSSGLEFVQSDEPAGTTAVAQDAQP